MRNGAAGAVSTRVSVTGSRAGYSSRILPRK